MAELEIGIGKSARRAYSLEEIAIVPSRRTRDPGDVDISWQLDAFRFPLPIIAAAMDPIVSPSSAIAIGELGGLAVLDLEGLWTRYADPLPLIEEIAALAEDTATLRMQQIYAAPLQIELVSERIKEISAAGIVCAGSVTPQHARMLAKTIMEAELDVLFIQGTVLSAEHVSRADETLDLKSFIRELDIPIIVGGCASYQAALHLMRTGAVGVLVGVGTGTTSSTGSVLGIGAPQATAISDAAGARSRHLEETGVYVQVIADGGISHSGDIAKAIACGADAVMIGSLLAGAQEAPGNGFSWGSAAGHASLPRGSRLSTPKRGSLSEILLGPAHTNDGRANLCGALRATMGLCGYASIREFHKAEVVIAQAPFGARAEAKPS